MAGAAVAGVCEGGSGSSNGPWAAPKRLRRCVWAGLSRWCRLRACWLLLAGRRRACGPVAGRKLKILDRLLRSCGEQWQEVVAAERPPGPGSQEAEVGGGGEDGAMREVLQIPMRRKAPRPSASVLSFLRLPNQPSTRDRRLNALIQLGLPQ